MKMDLALLVLRVVIGLALAAHGSQKLFGWFGGGGLQGTHGFIDMLGFRPTRFWAPAVAVGEFGGGLVMALGLLNPIGPLAIVAAMLTASLTAHRGKGFWNSKGGYELPLTNIAVAVAVAVAGPGRWSLDSLFGIALPQLAAIALTVLTLIGVAAGLASRRRAQPAAQASKAA
jgi:putative oxidoreductase